MPNETPHSYQLDERISNLRIVRSFYNFIKIIKKTVQDLTRRRVLRRRV